MRVHRTSFHVTQAIPVVANGGVVYDGRVDPDGAPLVKWAVGDYDRTMLYGAELHINLAR